MSIKVGDVVVTTDWLEYAGEVVAIADGNVSILVEDEVYTYPLNGIKLINEELPPLGVSVADGVGLKDRMGG